MVKRFLSFIAILPVLLMVSSAAASAQGNIPIAVAVGYAKGHGAYDIVVHNTPGNKLELYVNDKNPTKATVNKQGWATFRKVLLSGNGKISFTRVIKKDNGSYQKAINYTRHYDITGGQVMFSAVAAKAAPQPAPVTSTVPAPTPTPTSTNTGTSDTNLSNNNTYTNVDGETVHSPAASTDGSVPDGATAQCNDGTYSFSQHHSGTCSGHHGVASWL